MSYEVINSLRGPSIIRVDSPGTYSVELANLSVNTSIETVSNAAIKSIFWSTNGSITIARGAANMLTLFNSGEMRLADINYSLSNTSSANIVVTVASGGSCVLQVTKTATYSPPL